MTQESVYISGV